MATSATIKTNTTYDSSFWVRWSVEGQSVAENKTTICWACGFTPGHQFYTNAVKMSAVSINGNTVYAGGTYSDITDYKERTFASGTLEIAHNADGSKSFTVGAFSGQVYKGSGYLTASASAQSFDLPTIPRATTPSMGGVTIGGQAAISLLRASSAFTHVLTYTFGSNSGTIAQNAADSAVWDVPESLAAQIPDSASGVGTLTCDTYNGGTYIGSKSVTFTAAVPGSMKPSLASGWATVTYDNSSTKASGIAAWVQGYSKAKAVFDGSKVFCKHGAGVRGYSITYLGKTVAASPYRTDTISATYATVRCTVTDSRGLSAWEDISVSLLSYSPPMLVGADLFRSDSACAATDSGTHIAGIATVKHSTLGGLNSVRLTGYWRGMGGSYGSGVTMQSGAAGLVTGSTEIATDKSYVAKLVATDSLGNTAVYEENIPTEKVTFHLREGGLGAAFGKAAEEDRVLELAEDWTLKVNGRKVQADQFCNPNLLDNPCFQIWQRFPGYSFTGVPFNTYIADRWFILSSDGSALNTFSRVSAAGGITNISGPACRICQRLENAEQYNGKTLTMSMLKNGNRLYSETFVASGWTESTDIFAAFSDSLSWLMLGETIYAAKLELGTEQTLAHKDSNGNWALNEIPNYQEELVKCQRYCRPIPLGFFIAGDNAGSYYATAQANLPQMRAVPAIINGSFTGKKIREVTGDEFATIGPVFTPTVYGNFTMGLTLLGSNAPSYGYIDGTDFNPLLSADL